MRIILVVLYSILFAQSLLSQEKNTLLLTYRSSINKNDFFTGIAIGCSTKRIHSSFTLETGIVRTFFQQRAFPRAGINSILVACQNKKIISGPMFQYYFSTLQINSFAGNSGRVNYNDFLVGWEIKTKHKIHFSTDILFGYQTENRFNTLVMKRRTIGNFGYSLVCGIGYAF